MSVTNKAYQEKRGFIRMRVDTMVSFTVNGSNERYDARCRDLSGAGMLLETGKKLTAGQTLNITVPSEGPSFDNLNAAVEVVRVDAQPEQHKFLVGVAIKQIVN